jgi:hypothetical protein
MTVSTGESWEFVQVPKTRRPACQSLAILSTGEMIKTSRASVGRTSARTKDALKSQITMVQQRAALTATDQNGQADTPNDAWEEGSTMVHMVATSLVATPIQNPQALRASAGQSGFANV